MLRVALALTMLLVAPASARDDGRYAGSPNKDWFDHLQSDKGPCCADADGAALRDADWDTDNGHYRIRYQNQWWIVPDSAVIKEPNRDGRTIVWMYEQHEAGKLSGVEIRCFLRGSMS